MPGFHQKDPTRFKAVFSNNHGNDDVQAVTLSLKFKGKRLDAGQILVRHPYDGGYVPRLATALRNAATATNELQLESAAGFHAGDYVEVDGKFRRVVSADVVTGTVTVDGAALTLSKGAIVKLDGGYTTLSVTANATGSGGSTEIKVAGEAFKYAEAGHLIEIDGVSYPITAKSTSPDQITIAGEVTLKKDDVISVNINKDYRILIEDVALEKFEANALLPVRDHGRVATHKLIGFTPDLKKEFPLIAFDNRNL